MNNNWFMKQNQLKQYPGMSPKQQPVQGSNSSQLIKKNGCNCNKKKRY